MKNIKYIFILTIIGLFVSCTDILDEKMKVQVSADYLYSTPDGLNRVVTALYSEERTLSQKNNSELMAVQMLDYSTDLMTFRAGSATALARLDNLTADFSTVGNFWAHYYNIIGKANEVVSAAENMGVEDDIVNKAWAEAKVFRARSYFELLKRFDRIYLNTFSTNYTNLDRVFTPAKQEDVYTLINQDLTDAMAVLDWKVPSSSSGTSYGRFTKAVAKHIKAQVAMWQKNWDEAIAQCDDIISCPDYGLLDKRGSVFEGADLNNKEVLWTYQYANDIGGGGVIVDGSFVGHRMSLITTPNYKKVNGLGSFLAEHGGYGWGRVYPNQYLLNLYDKQKDHRYSEYYKHEWYYLDPEILPAGKNLGDVATVDNSLYLECLHPMTRKYFDKWTNADLPSRNNSFKDIIIYRLAETYLMAAEAYYHRDGSSSSKAIEYYNQTWERAGNDKFTGILTLNLLLDEYARELCFEGHRWALLKRLGILEERVKKYEGDTTAEDPKLTADVALARKNFKYYHWYWPIPQSEVDQMGKENFPQNEGY
ncbi:MAG: RagB/SusD family nutrient uptake outer membrane protein [Dysgonamonadaceae bacterium]|jgi:hypothetical protein|nr:RagB/SusD family nutrient uptake outer membrane protein [Dysgonamonadaceae bacterium]